MKRTKVIAIAAILCALPAIQARGELITFAFQGTVTYFDIDTGAGLQDFVFPKIGDSFSGFYSFESTVQTSQSPPGEGLFLFPPPKGSVSAEIGHFAFAGNAIAIVTFSGIYGVTDWMQSIRLTSNPALNEILNRIGFSERVLKLPA